MKNTPRFGLWAGKGIITLRIFTRLFQVKFVSDEVFSQRNDRYRIRLFGYSIKLFGKYRNLCPACGRTLLILRGTCAACDFRIPVNAPNPANQPQTPDPSEDNSNPAEKAGPQGMQWEEA